MKYFKSHKNIKCNKHMYITMNIYYYITNDNSN